MTTEPGASALGAAGSRAGFALEIVRLTAETKRLNASGDLRPRLRTDEAFMHLSEIAFGRKAERFAGKCIFFC